MFRVNNKDTKLNFPFEIIWWIFRTELNALNQDAEVLQKMVIFQGIYKKMPRVWFYVLKMCFA